MSSDNSNPQRPWIISPKLAISPLHAWRFQRPVIKQDRCCQCGQCDLYCPTGSIFWKGSHFESNLDYCKGCGVCAQVCPNDAVVMENEG